MKQIHQKWDFLGNQEKIDRLLYPKKQIVWIPGTIKQERKNFFAKMTDFCAKKQKLLTVSWIPNLAYFCAKNPFKRFW